MNISEHLSTTARIFPDNIAILFEGQAITYSELERKASAASRELLNAGIQPGDRVGIMLGNVPAFPVWYYAALKIGAIAVSISTRAADAEVAFLLEDCEASVLVSHSSQSSLPGCIKNSIETSDAGDVSLEDPETAALETYNAAPDDPALILYTSGTTGFPKGATLSHNNVRTNVCAFNHLCNMQPDDRILLAVPLFHCFGQNALLNSALNVGATLVLQRRFDLNETKDLISRHAVTQLYGVPVMFQLLLNSCSPDELASVNYCFSAAAKLPLKLAEAWREKYELPIHEGYGLTETSPFASYNHRLKFVPGSIGTPIDAVEMKVVDTESGNDCAPGELGEIVIKGPNVMLGYWNRKEETAAAIEDGWFHSGDIGRVDERGFFYIVDRVKDMIAVGGLKVFPAEVERVMLEHPAVRDVAVVGAADDVFGEQVIAFVVLEEANIAAGTLADIKEFTAQRLANYKVPRIVTRLEELPRNPSGKVLKRELRELVAEGGFRNEEEQASPQTQLRAACLQQNLAGAYESNYEAVATKFVQELIQDILQTEEQPEPGDRFLDIGLDSLMIVEVSNQIQVELGNRTDVPATLLFDYPRVSDLSRYLLNQLTEQSAVSSRKIVSASNADLRAEIESLSEEKALEELMKELES